MISFFQQDLTSLQTVFLMTGSLFIAISLYFHLSNKSKLSLMFLIVGSLAIFIFAALLDPFLNLWDERFHALVAKNLMNNPFKPMLYADPVMDIPYDRWDRAHIWLNKQPFFLWPAAVFFKIFGVSEFTLRIPSAIAGSILVLLAYRAGKLFISEGTGYYAAFLIATAFYMVEIISGRQELEHNDIAFLVWVSASIWAWLEYIRSGKQRWIVLIGIFSGVAILVKWLVGLLVYLGWAVYIVFSRGRGRKEIQRFIISALLAIAIAFSWYLFIILKYPGEAISTLSLYTAHFTKPLDGHIGNFWFHLNNISLLYGSAVPFIIIPACWILYRRVTPKSLSISLIFMILVVYLFFSLAKTKMPSLPWVVSLPIYLALGCLIDFSISAFSTIKSPRFFISGGIFVLIMFIGYSNLKIPTVITLHTNEQRRNDLLTNLQHNKAVFLDLSERLPANSVVFNVKGRHYVECMFYSGLPAYSLIPTENQIVELIAAGRRVAIFPKHGEQLPRYLTSNKEVTIIPYYLRGWE